MDFRVWASFLPPVSYINRPLVFIGPLLFLAAWYRVLLRLSAVDFVGLMAVPRVGTPS